MAELRRNCELCDEEATVYCESDNAFLCDTCDVKVHRANFLVARHVRVKICRNCRNFARKPSLARTTTGMCESCSPEVDDDDSVSSTSSSCVSSTSSSASSSRKRIDGATVAVDTRVEGILVNWCRRMDVEDSTHSSVVRMVVELLSRCLGKMTVLPFRVLLVAAFWEVVRTRGGGELGRLEQISGVPGKLILATEFRLARVVKRRRSREDHEEGWAES